MPKTHKKKEKARIPPYSTSASGEKELFSIPPVAFRNSVSVFLLRAFKI